MKPAIFGGNTPPLPAGVSIRVYVSGTATLATIYDFDSGLAIDQATLPFVADSAGRFAFTTDPGQMIDVQMGGEGSSADLLFNGGAARWFKNHTMLDPAAAITVAERAKLEGIAPAADVTAANETSHADVLLDGDLGVTVQAYDADTLKADTADVLTAGFAINKGAKSTAILTLDETEPNILSWAYTGNKTLNKPATANATAIKIYISASTGTLTLGAGMNLVAGAYVASAINVLTVDYDGSAGYVYINQVL